MAHNGKSFKHNLIVSTIQVIPIAVLLYMAGGR